MPLTGAEVLRLSFDESLEFYRPMIEARVRHLFATYPHWGMTVEEGIQDGLIALGKCRCYAERKYAAGEPVKNFDGLLFMAVRNRVADQAKLRARRLAKESDHQALDHIREKFWPSRRDDGETRLRRLLEEVESALDDECRLALHAALDVAETAVRCRHCRPRPCLPECLIATRLDWPTERAQRVLIRVRQAVKMATPEPVDARFWTASVPHRLEEDLIFA